MNAIISLAALLAGLVPATATADPTEVACIGISAKPPGATEPVGQAEWCQDSDQPVVLPATR